MARVEEMVPLSNALNGDRRFPPIPGFAFINERAYFDYQRDKVFVRTAKAA